MPYTIELKYTRCRVASSKSLSKTGLTFARAEICKFDRIIGNENIFRFDIAMEYAFAVDIVNSLEKLIHVDLDLAGLQVFVAD